MNEFDAFNNNLQLTSSRIEVDTSDDKHFLTVFDSIRNSASSFPNDCTYLSSIISKTEVGMAGSIGFPLTDFTLEQAMLVAVV